ncbi:MAG TPA: phenylalanine--tRNA ligase beta subunit-related protein, partial [Chloroflexia bacterium]|nr:phenylalanine--tRNA ligase beta subunit-related protein [Chloroflexia bacterium]
MHFFLGEDLLARAPDYMVGLVVARFATPPEPQAAAWAAGVLAEAVAGLLGRLLGDVAGARDGGPALVRLDPRIAAWRRAQEAIGLNPNRFPSSIEALALRIAKGGGLPSVNAVVDVANAVALRHLVPAGAHDLDAQTGDLGVRLSRPGDCFTPPGEPEEDVPPGEPVYVDGSTVRTRRWVWRQAGPGRVSEASTHLLFPVDGFRGQTDPAVLAAVQDLADLLSTLGATVAVYQVDRDCPAVTLFDAPAEAAVDIRALPIAADFRAQITRLA